MDKLVLVTRSDLLALLDYAQPDEEKDIERDPENDNPRHVVYVIRRLREQAETEERIDRPSRSGWHRS